MTKSKVLRRKRPISRSQSATHGDLQRTKILLNILKDQTINGGKEGTGYTKKAWREILEQFNESKVDKLELQQIKNRHKYYRSCYATMDRLLKHTGFGRDDDDKMIKAPEEKWAELILVSLSILIFI